MAGNHTPVRLEYRANGDANSYALIGDDGQWFISVLLNGQQMPARQEENLRRLAACWNACIDVPTDLLQANPAPFSALRAERDGLLAALRVAVRQNEHDMLMTGEELRAAQAAIGRHQTPAGQRKDIMTATETIAASAQPDCAGGENWDASKLAAALESGQPVTGSAAAMLRRQAAELEAVGAGGVQRLAAPLAGVHELEAAHQHALGNVALLADILNRRPAMNAGLAEAYGPWTAEVYELMGAIAAAPAAVGTQQRECCNEDCGWSGPASEAVYPKNDPSRLLCPRCHEVTEDGGHG